MSTELHNKLLDIGYKDRQGGLTLASPTCLKRECHGPCETPYPIQAYGYPLPPPQRVALRVLVRSLGACEEEVFLLTYARRHKIS